MRHIILILALLCAACSSSLPSIKPYKMDIQQGNVVTSKMMLQLRPGMTESQVRFIMGTPLIQDSFHKDRWDYFYQMRKDGKIIEQRRVILEFDQDALVRVRGDVVPAGSGQDITEPSPVSESGKAVAKQPGDKKGLIDKLKFWKDDKDVKKPHAAPADLVNPQPATPKPATPAKPAPESAPPEAMPPVVMPVEPAPTPEPAPAAAVKPVGPAQEMVAPAPLAEPVPQKPAEAPVAPAGKSVPATKPVVQPNEAAKLQATPKSITKPGPVDEPEKDLPPEDEPGYFERMLEKIGF
ncbi:MAG: outer membrane protein assembly factor BamE [Methylophilaceae bacterium]